MKKSGYSRGSVLMEFIIVFPIYLILFAGVVATGDMLIHSNRVISTDRMLSFEVDGHDGGTVSSTSGWTILAGLNPFVPGMFHPLDSDPQHEIADDGSNQDVFNKRRLACYTPGETLGAWTVCSEVAAVDNYKLLAGGTLGQLLAVPAMMGGTVSSNPFSVYADGEDVYSTQSSFGGDGQNRVSYFVIKRRDHFIQRNHRRVDFNKYIDEDVRNWRDRGYVSRLLLGGTGTEYWRRFVASDNPVQNSLQWHTEDSIQSRSSHTSDVLPDRKLLDYQRYDAFIRLSE